MKDVGQDSWNASQIFTANPISFLVLKIRATKPNISSLPSQHRDRDRHRGVRGGGAPPARLLHVGVGGDDARHHLDHLPRTRRSLLPHRRTDHHCELHVAQSVVESLHC